MILNGNEYYRNLENLHDECEKYLAYHVVLKMADGSTVDGIIQKVDKDRIVILVGEDVMEEEENQVNQQRQPFGGHQRRRFRRFRPRTFPLGALAALTLLQYPYVIPPYPYFFPF